MVVENGLIIRINLKVKTERVETLLLDKSRRFKPFCLRKLFVERLREVTENMASNYEMSGDLFQFKLEIETKRRQQEILEDEVLKYQIHKYKRRLREEKELNRIEQEDEIVQLKDQVLELQSLILKLQFKLNSITS